MVLQKSHMSGELAFLEFRKMVRAITPGLICFFKALSSALLSCRIIKYLLKQHMAQLELKGFHVCGGFEFCFIPLRTYS